MVFFKFFKNNKLSSRLKNFDLKIKSLKRWIIYKLTLYFKAQYSEDKDQNLKMKYSSFSKDEKNIFLNFFLNLNKKMK